jgi:hypothetical protein
MDFADTFVGFVEILYVRYDEILQEKLWDTYVYAKIEKGVCNVFFLKKKVEVFRQASIVGVGTR